MQRFYGDAIMVPRNEGKKFGRELVRKGKKNEVKKSCLVGIKIILHF